MNATNTISTAVSTAQNTPKVEILSTGEIIAIAAIVVGVALYFLSLWQWRTDKKMQGYLLILRAFMAHVYEIYGGWPGHTDHGFKGYLQLIGTPDAIWHDLDHLYEQSAEGLAGCVYHGGKLETIEKDINERIINKDTWKNYGSLKAIHNLDKKVRKHHGMGPPSKLQDPKNAKSYNGLLTTPKEYGSIAYPIFPLGTSKFLPTLKNYQLMDNIMIHKKYDEMEEDERRKMEEPPETNES